MTTRLFPDFAALPTANDRKLTRRNNQRQQLDMFATDELDERACPVCAGEHTESECQHGTAPQLPTTFTRNPSNPAQVRAMFASFGWPTTKGTR